MFLKFANVKRFVCLTKPQAIFSSKIFDKLYHTALVFFRIPINQHIEKVDSHVISSDFFRYTVDIQSLSFLTSRLELRKFFYITFLCSSFNLFFEVLVDWRIKGEIKLE